MFSILSVLIVFPCRASPAKEAENTDAQARTQPSGGIVEEIRSLSETGKLSSMLRAIELVRSRDVGGSEFGRVMTGVNTLLIRLVYPDSPAALPPLDLPQTHNYTRILREAERGSYIRPPSGSTDFFEYVLPFFAINDKTGPDILKNALTDLAKAGELQPFSVLPFYFEGVVHELAGDIKNAETAYRKAYGISNECYPALAGAARMRRLAGDTRTAVAIFSDLIIQYPDSNDIKRQLARAYYEIPDWQNALRIVDEVLLSEPRNGETLLMKAHILIEQGQYMQAAAPLDVYAAINANNRDYLFYRARVQAEGIRNRDSALNFLRSILRANENDTEAMMYAARLLMESQRPADQQEGRELLGRLRLGSGSSIEVISLSLQDAIRRESWREAQGYLGFILNIRRAPADLVNAYNIERGLGNNSAALAYARELYNLDNANHEYLTIYISSLIDNGSRAEALRLLERAINQSNNGKKSQFYYLRSRLRSDEEDILSDLRSSIFEDPRNLDAIIAMFEIYHRRREERRAVYYLRQALAIAPDKAYLKRFQEEYAALLERN